MSSVFWPLLLSCVLIDAFAQPAPSAQPVSPEPKTSIEWFQRASERMNLRMPGCSPFHMRVTFHAFPGKEFLSVGQKPEIVTGDGVYEEVWAAPHKWRREVTLASYHAVEVESEKGRKMQASSGYEPSRVLMLLNALLTPIPRNFSSREFRHQGASGWTIDHLAKGGLSLVRISTDTGGQGASASDSFYFLPQGTLALRNDLGLETMWEDDSLFAGKIVPKHVSIKGGDRDLLTAIVLIEDAGEASSSMFDLPVSVAEPGMTLHPFQAFEVKFPDLAFRHGWVKGGGDTSQPGFSLWEVLDRHGRYREVELILVMSDKDAESIMTFMRQERNHPAEVDGSPCQLVMSWAFL